MLIYSIEYVLRTKFVIKTKHEFFSFDYKTLTLARIKKKSPRFREKESRPRFDFGSSESWPSCWWERAERSVQLCGKSGCSSPGQTAPWLSREQDSRWQNCPWSWSRRQSPAPPRPPPGASASPPASSSSSWASSSSWRPPASRCRSSTWRPGPRRPGSLRRARARTTCSCKPPRACSSGCLGSGESNPVSSRADSTLRNYRPRLNSSRLGNRYSWNPPIIFGQILLRLP